MKVSALVLGIVALAFPTCSPAALTTTAPGKAVLVNVKITDRGISTAMFAKTTERGATNYLAEYNATRGQIAYFVIHNLGKRPHNFTVLGKNTNTIRPGGKAHFHLVLTLRGAFPYQSTLDRGKKGFRGVFTVN